MTDTTRKRPQSSIVENAKQEKSQTQTQTGNAKPKKFIVGITGGCNPLYNKPNPDKQTTI